MKWQYTPEEKGEIRDQTFRYGFRLFGWGWLILFGGYLLMMEYPAMEMNDGELFRDHSMILDAYDAPYLSPVLMAVLLGAVLLVSLISIIRRWDHIVVVAGAALLSLPVLYVQLPALVSTFRNPDVTYPFHLIYFAILAWIAFAVQLLILVLQRKKRTF